MNEGKLNFLIGGAAGSGVEKSGKTLALSFVRGGYFVFANGEHMSQIRGGNNFLRVRVGTEAVDCHVEETDVIIALDKQTIEEHIGEVSDGGVVIFDGSVLKLEEGFDAGRARLLDIPLKKIAEEEFGNPIMANVIALGVVCGLVEFDIKGLRSVLKKIFAKKSAEIIAANEKAAMRGYEMASAAPEAGKKWAADFPVKLPTKEGAKRMLLEGNEALCMGSVKAGCKFVGEYPMTPSSSVLHFMARWAEKYGMVVKHVEDEIAAVNSLVGAGFMGVRAMTGTSGGGFALMSEGIGLAAMNEVPIVIVNVMRPGPATGQPTRSGQGDLRQMIHAGQDDPCKIVLLPSDIDECFKFGFEAFNLAEKYQVPVIIAYDKYLGESLHTREVFNEEGMEIDRGKIVDVPGEDYKRYLRTEDGVSPRTLPGTKGGIHRATSDEHNEYGEIFEGAENRKLMVEKRMKKIAVALADCPGPELIGEEGADITFVTWGSNKAALKEVIAESGVSANILVLRTAFPFHVSEVSTILKTSKRSILVEQNYTGQLGGLIAEQTGVQIEEKILRYDGRPITAEFILKNINQK